MENPVLANSRKWYIFFGVAISTFMSTLDGSIVNIALPVMMKDLGVELSTIQWVLTAYSICVAALLLSLGRLSDIRGRKWVFTRGLWIFSASSLLCGIAQSAHWLISVRCLQGIGAAMIMSSGTALIVDTFPRSERGRVLGMVSTAAACGLSAGPALGGLLLHNFSWRVIFYANVPVGGVTALAFSSFLKDTSSDRSLDESFDWTGALLLATSILSVVFVLSHANGWGYTSLRTILWCVLSAMIAASFLWFEAKASSPILDLGLFSIRLFAIAAVSVWALFAGLFFAIFLLPFYLTLPCSYPVYGAGLLMVTPFVFMFFISPFSGTLSDRFGSKRLCFAGMALVSIALFSFSALDERTNLPQILWRLALLGLGMSIFIPPNTSSAMNAVPANRRGVAAGTLATARILGMVVGVTQASAIFNGIFSRLSGGLSLQDYSPQLAGVFVQSFRYALAAGGLIALCGAIFSVLRGPETTALRSGRPL